MYRGVPYRVHDWSAIDSSIKQVAASNPDARRVFLADGDVLALPTPLLEMILDQMRLAFPHLSRVNCYASGQALAEKSDRELGSLRAKGLHTLYLGLESGCAEVLRRMGKGAGPAEAVAGSLRASSAGLSMSVMVLVGIGGQELSAEHVFRTAQALNAMQPALLSCLRLVPIPGTVLAKRIAQGRFVQLTEEESMRELREIVSGLDLARTVFRADHSSNILPLAGRLPRDKARLLAEMDELLECGVLATDSPGPMPAVL
jgi:radical SAM superfamily enzyme YgiQ (UPF0313 family)